MKTNELALAIFKIIDTDEKAPKGAGLSGGLPTFDGKIEQGESQVKIDSDVWAFFCRHQEMEKSIIQLEVSKMVYTIQVARHSEDKSAQLLLAEIKNQLHSTQQTSKAMLGIFWLLLSVKLPEICKNWVSRKARLYAGGVLVVSDDPDFQSVVDVAKSWYTS